MPYTDGAKIQLINESEERIENLFYYVNYETYDNKEQVPDDLGRFHATWNHENPCEKVVYKKEQDNPAPWELPDPIRFNTSLRATIEHGHAND